MQAADQPFPKLLSTNLCDLTFTSLRRHEPVRSSVGVCIQGRGREAVGTSSTQPALRGSICDRSPRSAVVKRFAGAQTHARGAEPACPQMDACTSRGRRSCKSSVLVAPGTELQPHATLDRSPSLSQLKLFCLQTICSAPRCAGSGKGAQMDGFFDNSLKRSTQAQRHHMPKGRPARRAVAQPSLLGLAMQAVCSAGSAPPGPRRAPSPAESLQAFPGAALSLPKAKWPEGDSSSWAVSSLHTLHTRSPSP